MNPIAQLLLGQFYNLLSNESAGDLELFSTLKVAFIEQPLEQKNNCKVVQDP